MRRYVVPVCNYVMACFAENLTVGRLEMNEASLRDQLATRLELLETGLTLIETEHALPNPLGAKGFIDILAKDRFGNRVIIELKRSKQASRQALHEIVKYVALFIGQHGVPADRIRCFVVSTEWHELLVPFAKFVDETDFQAEGFQLDLKSGEVVSARPIELPTLTKSFVPFYNHGCFLFKSEESRTASTSHIAASLSDAGATAYLLLLMDFDGVSSAVIYPWAVYIVPLEITPDSRKEMTCKVEEDCDDLTTDEMKMAVEEQFHADVITKAGDLRGHFDTYEIGYPEKFSGMLHSGWRAREIHRVGALGEAAAGDDEVLRLVAGVEGQSDVRYYRTISPRVLVAWNNLEQDSARCFLGNAKWASAFNTFCKWIAADWPNAVVTIGIFNPMNLPVSLYKLAAHADARFLPSMELVAFNETQQCVRFMSGELRWNGETIPDTLHSLSAALGGDLESFFMRMHVGEAWECDSNLVSAHGMSYSFVCGEVEGGATRLVEEQSDLDEAGRVYMSGNRSEPLSTFYESAKDYLTLLVAEMNHGQTGL